MTSSNPYAQRSIPADRNLTLLVAELRIGLRFAQAAVQATDPWVVAANRAKAERVHDAVQTLMDRLSITAAGRAFLRPRLEELRLAIQTAYAWQPQGQFGSSSRAS
jgi:hypothetical protein